MRRIGLFILLPVVALLATAACRLSGSATPPPARLVEDDGLTFSPAQLPDARLGEDYDPSLVR